MCKLILESPKAVLVSYFHSNDDPGEGGKMQLVNEKCRQLRTKKGSSANSSFYRLRVSIYRLEDLHNACLMPGVVGD